MEDKKKRKCLTEITNTTKHREVEYGHVVEDEDIIDLDLVDSDSEEFYKDFYIILK
jgi:hypothetical protein